MATRDAMAVATVAALEVGLTVERATVPMTAEPPARPMAPTMRAMMALHAMWPPETGIAEEGARMAIHVMRPPEAAIAEEDAERPIAERHPATVAPATVAAIGERRRRQQGEERENERFVERFHEPSPWPDPSTARCRWPAP